MKTLTEQQWWAKARRHQAWDAAWLAELAALESTIEGINDVQQLRRIIDRADAIEKRSALLKRIMGRHLERAPDLFPSLSQRRPS